VRDALAGVRISELPVTLRFWDGSVLAGGQPVVEVRDPLAFAHVLHAPGQMGLARAWVSGALDVSDVGDLEAILRLRSFKLDLTPRDGARLFAAAV
jgi:cyclopropane-fatty-acyl-phospholipid synthase